MKPDNIKIHEKLDELATNPKSKNFLNHLVKAYFPVGKIIKVMDKPESKFRCVLTNAPLISIAEALDGVQSEAFKHDFFEQIKEFTSDGVKTVNPMKTMLNGRVLGFTGDKTNTYISQEGYQAFYDWIVTKMLKGDKHINWLIKSMQKKQFIGRAELIATDDESKAALQRIKKNSKNGRRATQSLGDFTALQALKDKFESEGK